MGCGFIIEVGSFGLGLDDVVMFWQMFVVWREVSDYLIIHLSLHLSHTRPHEGDSFEKNFLALIVGRFAEQIIRKPLIYHCILLATLSDHLNSHSKRSRNLRQKPK